MFNWSDGVGFGVLRRITPLYEFLEKHCPSLEPLNHNMLTETLGSYVIVNSFAIQEVSGSCSFLLFLFFLFLLVNR